MKLMHTILAVAAFSIAPTVLAADSVATVNGKPIKQSIYDVISKDITANGQKIDDNTKNAIVEELISSELIYQEAQKLGLDKQPDFVVREELARRKLLTSAYLQDYVKNIRFQMQTPKPPTSNTKKPMATKNITHATFW